jgi:hypothetical protein
VLYAGDDGLFACRTCRSLIHAIEPATECKRIMLRAQKAREKLGCFNLLDPLPERPKGMPLARYNRLRAKAYQATARWVALETEHLVKAQQPAWAREGARIAPSRQPGYRARLRAKKAAQQAAGKEPGEGM